MPTETPVRVADEPTDYRAAAAYPCPDCATAVIATYERPWQGFGWGEYALYSETVTGVYHGCPVPRPVRERLFLDWMLHDQQRLDAAKAAARATPLAPRARLGEAVAPETVEAPPPPPVQPSPPPTVAPPRQAPETPRSGGADLPVLLDL